MPQATAGYPKTLIVDKLKRLS